MQTTIRHTEDRQGIRVSYQRIKLQDLRQGTKPQGHEQVEK